MPMARTIVAAWAVVVASGCIATRRPDERGRYSRHGVPDRFESPSAVRFAVFGDYGGNTEEEADVARLVEAWEPDFLLTTGDNNYPSGDQSTIDRNVGKFFHEWIYPYHGIYGAGAGENRFWPAIGNHDWMTPFAAPYRAYFTLPGNERYYDFAFGPAHFFSVDSDPHEGDGIDRASAQAAWLEAGLAAAPEPWRFVYFHHSPFSSSSSHGTDPKLQWPFAAWGASAVLTGHDHVYEHLSQGGLDYVITGLGGESLYDFGEAVAGSRTQYRDDFGALFVDLDEDVARFQFVTRALEVIDEFTIGAAPPRFHESLVPAGSSWRFQSFGAVVGAGWTEAVYDDSAWGEGEAPLGADRPETWTAIGGLSTADALTAYFRRKFDVDDPTRIRALDLGLVRDDGAVVYLNGTEVYRTNLPEGAVSPLTPAEKPVQGVAERAFHAASIPPDLLVAGENVLAIEVHELEAADDDLLFDATLDARVGDPILASGSTWRYDDAGNEPASDWFLPEFDDSAWPEGAAQLGVGEADETTPIAQTEAVYFRTTFEWTAGSFESVLLRLLRDDGAIVYVNGEEVLRSNMPLGDVFAGTLASSDVVDGADDRWQESLLPIDLLVEGENVIAVELHASSSSSPDASFDLEVSGL